MPDRPHHRAKREDGLCKVKGCRAPLAEGAEYRSMCLEHAETKLDGRPRCRNAGCYRPSCQPYTDRFCKVHHPSYQKLSPLQSQVVEQMARGVAPVAAVEMATGLPRAEAARELKEMEKSLAFQHASRAQMDEADLTLKHCLTTLRENTVATRTALSKEGEVVDLGRDYRASNQAIDIALKLGAYYPQKKVERDEVDRSQTFNVAIVVPPQKQLENDAPIFTIRKDED